MSFYNKKEDVIDIELTTHGKRLLSEGKFKPVYYSFFDDDIIYDGNAGGATEAQNESQSRITGSLRIKNQVNYVGAETSVKQVINEVRTEKPEINDTDFIPFQSVKEKEYALGPPLGTASPVSEFIPAWKVSALRNQFDSTSPYLTSSIASERPGGPPAHPSRRIPQITANLNCSLETVQNIDDFGYQDSDDVEIIHVFNDRSAIIFKKEDLILDLLEVHGVFSKENFDIEVTELDGTVDFLNNPRATTCHYTGSTMSFVGGETNLTINPVLDSTYVEYFLDIFVDKEINQDIMCRLKPADPAKGIFDKRSVECTADEDAKNEDVYGIPLNEEDGLGPCED